MSQRLEQEEAKVWEWRLPTVTHWIISKVCKDEGKHYHGVEKEGSYSCVQHLHCKHLQGQPRSCIASALPKITVSQGRQLERHPQNSALSTQVPASVVLFPKPLRRCCLHASHTQGNPLLLSLLSFSLRLPFPNSAFAQVLATPISNGLPSGMLWSIS